MLLTHKAGLESPGAGEWGHGGARFRSAEGWGCIFSYPVNAWLRFPSRAGAKQGSSAGVLWSPAQSHGRQAREVLWGGGARGSPPAGGTLSPAPPGAGEGTGIQNTALSGREVLAEKGLSAGIACA